MECFQCHRTFTTAQALHAHCVAKTDHPYCEECQRLFGDFHAYEQHIETSAAHQDNSGDDDGGEDTGEESDEDAAYCDACDRQFSNEISLFQHRVANTVHHWCFVCSRDFGSARALEQHSLSGAHKPRKLSCPLCQNGFSPNSAMIQHIESGVCRRIVR